MSVMRVRGMPLALPMVADGSHGSVSSLIFGGYHAQ